MSAIDNCYDQTSNNWALFTHNIFEITDGLKLTLGLRYTHETKELEVDLQQQQQRMLDQRGSSYAGSTSGILAASRHWPVMSGNPAAKFNVVRRATTSRE